MSISLLLVILAGSVAAVSSEAQPGIIETLLLALEKRPWLLGVYVFTVGLPVILFISLMWPDKRFGPPDQPYYYKKSDDVQPDDDDRLLHGESAVIQRGSSTSEATSVEEATTTHKRKPNKRNKTNSSR